MEWRVLGSVCALRVPDRGRALCPASDAAALQCCVDVVGPASLNTVAQCPQSEPLAGVDRCHDAVLLSAATAAACVVPATRNVCSSTTKRCGAIVFRRVPRRH